MTPGTLEDIWDLVTLMYTNYKGRGSHWPKFEGFREQSKL